MAIYIQNNRTPLISVVIPVYNSAKYLDRCITSIVRQTYTNFEILLVDDGSCDGSGEICDRWGNLDSRIRVFHKENEGPGIARNKGLEMCGGAYITFVDSDDWIEPVAYEKLLKLALDTKADIVGCASIVDYEDGSHRENYSDMQNGIIDKNILILNILESNRHAWGAVHNKLFSRCLFDDVRFPNVKHYEDYIVITKLFYKANFVYFCKNPYYHHIVHTGSLSMSEWNPARLTIPKTIESIIFYLQDCNCNAAVRKATYKFRFFSYVNELWLLHKSNYDGKSRIKTELRKDSAKAFFGYILHSTKKKEDIRMIAKYILAVF